MSAFTPTPVAETVAMLQKQIAGYVLMPTNPEVLETALAGMRRGIDRLNTRNWNWALDYDDLDFAVDQYDYELTSWFKAPRSFEVWDTNGESVFKLGYKPWKTFLDQHQNLSLAVDPCVYSCSNPSAFGSVSLDAKPSAAWVSQYPQGRIWYYRRMQYPTGAALNQALDVPSPATLFVQAYAEGYVAERHAIDKATLAYARATQQFKDLVKDDNDVQTDWE